MEKKSLWSFGTREVVYAAIGAALYAVVSYLTNFLQIPSAGNVSFRPGVVIPIFFGVAFGPLVGFISGFLGNILGDLLSGYGFWFWWDLGNGLMGLIPGLIAGSLAGFRDGKSILSAEFFAILGIVLGMGLASLSEMWVSGADMATVIGANFIPAAVTNAVNALILLPILMVAYDAVVARSGR
ncbi:MAG: ECF transporter S component [Chloroflexi bacterium]|jgi:energy-coupling factor transport system substrate-specific component|nr:ECF transporter S component [Chloroflexota bacterium]